MVSKIKIYVIIILIIKLVRWGEGRREIVGLKWPAGRISLVSPSSLESDILGHIAGRVGGLAIFIVLRYASSSPLLRQCRSFLVSFSCWLVAVSVRMPHVYEWIYCLLLWTAFSYSVCFIFLIQPPISWNPYQADYPRSKSSPSPNS